MEQTDRDLRKQANQLGILLLLYAAILCLAALDASGWSRCVAPFVLLLLWKPFRKPCVVGKPMHLGSFFMLLTLTLGTQLIAQLTGLVLPGKATVTGNSLAVFLYACLLAPMAEEVLFRHFVLRVLAPHSKKLALFASAFLFAMLHGDARQLPYAFLLGLVLGYAAMHYHILWPIALHILNNLFFGYGLPFLLSGLPNLTYSWAFWSITTVFFVVSVAILANKSVPIYAWLRGNHPQRSHLTAFFGSIPVLLFLLLSLLNLFSI